jgi:putative DNA primase/helicase
MNSTITRIKEIARGRWPLILKQFGVAKEYLVNRHGPCPVCGGADRFRFDNKGGNGTFYCNKCGPGDGINLVMKLTGMGYKDAMNEIDRVVGGADPVVPAKVAKAAARKTVSDPDDLQRMQRLWDRGTPVTAGDPVALYLASRGIGISRRLQNLRTVLTGNGDAMMVARVQRGSRNCSETQACQLHRTILARGDFTREKKMMPGVHPPGSAVRLFEPGPVLGIAEGIETALSAATMFQVPVWAALTGGRLSTFVPPPGVRMVRIFADHDANRVGLDAAINLARLLEHAGIGVNIELPPGVDTDWNDVLAKFMAGAIDAGAVDTVEGRRMYFSNAVK